MAVLIDRIELKDNMGVKVTVDLTIDSAVASGGFTTAALDKRDWKFVSEIRDLFEDRREDRDKWNTANEEGTFAE